MLERLLKNGIKSLAVAGALFVNACSFNTPAGFLDYLDAASDSGYEQTVDARSLDTGDAYIKDSNVQDAGFSSDALPSDVPQPLDAERYDVDTADAMTDLGRIDAFADDAKGVDAYLLDGTYDAGNLDADSMDVYSPDLGPLDSGSCHPTLLPPVLPPSVINANQDYCMSTTAALSGYPSACGSSIPWVSGWEPGQVILRPECGRGLTQIVLEMDSTNPSVNQRDFTGLGFFIVNVPYTGNLVGNLLGYDTNGDSSQRNFSVVSN